MFSDLPIGRRIAMTALITFCTAILVVTVIGGLSTIYAVKLMQIVACVLAAIVVLAALRNHFAIEDVPKDLVADFDFRLWKILRHRARVGAHHDVQVVHLSAEGNHFDAVH